MPDTWDMPGKYQHHCRSPFSNFILRKTLKVGVFIPASTEAQRGEKTHTLRRRQR